MFQNDLEYCKQKKIFVNHLFKQKIQEDIVKGKIVLKKGKKLWKDKKNAIIHSFRIITLFIETVHLTSNSH